MATKRHTVKVEVPPNALELSSADLKITVRDRDEKIGTLLVSRGAIEWRTANGKVLYRSGWERFDRLMRGEV